MRVLLFTGKGGVGKTTLASATAAHIASQGQKVLLLSADSAHSIGDAYGIDLDQGVAQLSDGLFVRQADAQHHLEQSWDEIQRYLVALLGAAGIDDLRAEELTVLPGAEELLTLIELREQVDSGRWDVVVVDCAPTGETLRLLALPEILDWYLSKALPIERHVARALRPVLGSAVGLPLPKPEVWE